MMNQTITSRILAMVTSCIMVAPLLFGGAAGDQQAYVVTVRPDASIDGIRVVAKQIAASYGGTVLEGEGSGEDTFVIRLPQSRARLLAADPHVKSVGPMRLRPEPQAVVETVNWSSGVSYSYDGSGNISQIGNDVFVYDGVSRLVRATVNGVNRTYQYDAYGNRTACTQFGPNDCQGFSINTDENKNRIAGAGYDAAGNVTSLSGHVYSYDALNMMIRDSFGQLSREFVYTADDERIATYTVGSSWSWTVRGTDGKVLREFASNDGPAGIGTASWRWTKDHVWRNGLLLASRQPDGVNTTTYHYHLDHLGTPRRVTDQNDRIVGIHDYLVFGPELSGATGEPSATALRYTGHERDDWSNAMEALDYMHARYYSPTLGRFLSVDAHVGTPTDPQSWHRYAYARSNPLKYVDPNGKDIQLAGANRAAVLTFLSRTAQHPQGRADLTAIANNHHILVTYYDQQINTPQQVATIRRQGGHPTLATTVPDRITNATTFDVAIDTSAVPVLHHADPSGVTTTAHEDKHVTDAMNNMSWAQVAATDANGSAERYGASVAASRTDMSQQQAQAYVEDLLSPAAEPPQTLTDVRPDLPPSEN